MFIVKVPGINSNGKTDGCENAGNRIISQLKEISSNERGNPINVQTLDLEEIHLDNSDLDLSNKLIHKNSLEIYEEKPKTIFIGGDHSISYSLTKSFFEYCNRLDKDPCIIIFDAHSDCKNYSGEKFPKNDEWLRKLIEEGFPGENVFLVGSRNSEPSEIKFLDENNVKRMSMDEVFENPEDSCDILMEFSKGKEVYISIDIDVIDPAFAPGTERKEPGGFTSRQLIYFLQRFNSVKGIRAIDVVEVNPGKDVEGLTVKLGAKLVSELL